MIKDLKYMKLNYTDSDIEYIDKLCLDLDFYSNEIVSFFNIKCFGEKVNVYLFDNLEKFRKIYNNTFLREPKKWVCGFSKNNVVNTLSLCEYKKCEGHEDSNYEDLLKLILHEFTHSTQDRVNDYHNIIWFSEGLATYLSHQYDNEKLKFNASYDQLLHGGCSYVNYYVLFKYVIDNYGKEYILRLLNDNELLIGESKKLIDEFEKNCSYSK